MNLLRETIRKLILEGLNFDAADKLSLLVHTSGYRTHYILVDHDQMLEYLKEKLQEPIVPWKIARDCLFSGNSGIVVGAVRVHRLYEDTHWGAAEIKLSGAEKGWGPTLYDIVMGEEPNGIMADRDSVISAAYGLWEYYRDNRNDIERKPLDSEVHKWTPETIDDGEPGSSGDYVTNFDPETQEQFLEDATCWVFNRDPHPKVASWKANAGEINSLLEEAMDEKTLKDFFFELTGSTYDYYAAQ